MKRALDGFRVTLILGDEMNMNLVYGAFAVVISLLISDKFSKSQFTGTKCLIFAAVAEFIAIVVLGAVFYFFKWGFFADALSTKDLLIKVFGLAIFLAILVGMRALNKSNQRLEQ